MSEEFTSSAVGRIIDELLLSGRARSVAEAESLFLDQHLNEIARVVVELDDEAFVRHEAVKLLLAYGSRPWEDSLR
jgi:hypothetical protein